MYLFRFIIDMFCVSFYYIIHVLLALVVLGLVSSVPSQEIGREERRRNDLFCVKWDVQCIASTQSINIGYTVTEVLNVMLIA